MYGGLELPTGIPLGPSGVALFGFAGLLALNMRPGRAQGEAWYSITPPDWYHKATVGVNDLANKWEPKDGTAFSAGLTLGTYADNGFTFSARAVLVIAFPGPVILIEGQGNLLADRKSGPRRRSRCSGRSPCSTWGAGEYSFGMDAGIKYATANAMPLIAGSVEAFYVD